MGMVGTVVAVGNAPLAGRVGAWLTLDGETEARQSGQMLGVAGGRLRGGHTSPCCVSKEVTCGVGTAGTPWHVDMQMGLERLMVLRDA